MRHFNGLPYARMFNLIVMLFLIKCMLGLDLLKGLIGLPMGNLSPCLKIQKVGYFLPSCELRLSGIEDA